MLNLLFQEGSTTSVQHTNEADIDFFFFFFFQRAVFTYSQMTLRCKWYTHRYKDAGLPPYLSYTCGWEVSLADLCADGSSERGDDPGQTW